MSNLFLKYSDYGYHKTADGTRPYQWLHQGTACCKQIPVDNGRKTTSNNRILLFVIVPSMVIPSEELYTDDS